MTFDHMLADGVLLKEEEYVDGMASEPYLGDPTPGDQSVGGVNAIVIAKIKVCAEEGLDFSKSVSSIDGCTGKGDPTTKLNLSVDGGDLENGKTEKWDVLGVESRGDTAEGSLSLKRKTTSESFIEDSAFSGHDSHGVHACFKCGWPFPSAHSSARDRHAPKCHVETESLPHGAVRNTISNVTRSSKRIIKKLFSSLLCSSRTSSHGTTLSGPQFAKWRNNSKDFKLKPQTRHDGDEWVEEDEVGVCIMLVALPGGFNYISGVCFCEKRFNTKKQVRQWWKGNRSRIYQQYNVSSVNHLVHAMKFN